MQRLTWSMVIDRRQTILTISEAHSHFTNYTQHYEIYLPPIHSYFIMHILLQH